MARGRFITFEGGEGAGKSTQVKRLAEALRRASIDCVETREPGGAPGAEEIRRLLVTGEIHRWDPMTEALLHCAARREHLVRTVRPSLESGRWVISDRFADSTMAYQGYAQGVGREAIEALTRVCTGGVAPDLTLILDVPPGIGLKRADERSHDETRYERMAGEFHVRLREAFLDIARREPARCAVIDGTGEIAAVEAAIRKVVAERLGVRIP